MLSLVLIGFHEIYSLKSIYFSVNMYIENPFITSYTTDVEMSGLDIISSIGGLLGLFIGKYY